MVKRYTEADILIILERASVGLQERMRLERERDTQALKLLAAIHGYSYSEDYPYGEDIEQR
jgi:hypothetical protein